MPNTRNVKYLDYGMLVWTMENAMTFLVPASWSGDKLNFQFIMLFCIGVYLIAGKDAYACRGNQSLLLYY